MIFFYSWQSDHRATKQFIETCLQQAIEQLNEKIELQESERPSEDLKIKLDRDTLGVPGIPEITTTIFNKIENCDVFIADVSFVGKGIGKAERLLPNPNVLIELGYAIGKIGHERILLLMDTRYGKPEGNIPFDLAHRRHPVKFSTDVADKEAQQNNLIKELVRILSLYQKRAPLIQVVLDVELVYSYLGISGSEYDPKERSFQYEVFATNKSHQKIEDYKVHVLFPELIWVKESLNFVFNKGRPTHICFEEKGEPLYPGERVRVAKVYGSVASNIIAHRKALLELNITVELYADGIPKQIASIPMSNFDPFKLMDITVDDIETNRTYRTFSL